MSVLVLKNIKYFSDGNFSGFHFGLCDIFGVVLTYEDFGKYFIKV